ncbi:ATP-binding cassette domain-containing protein [Azonexus hydrophilus]|uniref:ATP-binding cassette domain-containing protein n=1 Tax=Azonexus hydrophilus TaxID=418702 RepID=UPI00042407FB|nr:ATP-binding cassette domain-containing protein [Azonexus hydrophilus]
MSDNRTETPTPLFAFSLRKPLAFAGGESMLNIRLDLPAGQWLALQGASGAGKTSLLRLLAGLETPSAGHIRLGDAIWLDSERGLSLPTCQRQIGLVFQEHALFPHMSARRQLDFARRPGQAAPSTDELLALVGLNQLAERYPAALSGGQKQRLALARTLASAPRVLLLDEPLSALDPALRRSMQALLQQIRDSRLVDCAILVTHDLGEARHLADRIVRVHNGRIHGDRLNHPSIHPPLPFHQESPCILPAACF